MRTVASTFSTTGGCVDDAGGTGCTTICPVALFVPFVLVYLGWPQVTVQEICGELYNITYQDDDRECRHPYPLVFQDPTPEPNFQESKEQVFGPVTPPRPRYDVPGWREMISIVERRRAAQAGAAHE